MYGLGKHSKEAKEAREDENFVTSRLRIAVQVGGEVEGACSPIHVRAYRYATAACTSRVRVFCFHLTLSRLHMQLLVLGTGGFVMLMCFQATSSARPQAKEKSFADKNLGR